MMVGAGALSMKKLRYVPRSMDAMHTPTAVSIMALKLRTTRNAIAPGAIRRPMARIRPAAVSVATMVSESAASRP